MTACASGACGVQGFDGPNPADPNSNSILSATPVFGGIYVSWTYPTTNPYSVAFFRLYRGIDANFANALQIAEVGGSFFNDVRTTATTYYYWIEIVSVLGTVSDPIGPASAVAEPSTYSIMLALTGEIDSSLLATSLRNELDQISILNTNLLNEVTDREGGETTLAAAMADVAADMAEAHTFIIDEINTRATETSALAESIDAVVVTLGGSIASAVTTLQAGIDEVTDEVYASWSAQVNVNGMIGGFGLMGSATSVDAGFDVDTFWIGRTDGTSKVKPFIVSGGVVYIDSARITNLDASVITAGYINAARISVGTATVAADDNWTSGSVTFGTPATTWPVSKSDVVTLVSTGSPVTVTGVIWVSVVATGGSPVTCAIDAFFETVDGVAVGGGSATVDWRPMADLSGNKIARVSIPVAFRVTPAAGSHTYGYSLQASLWGATAAQLSSGTLTHTARFIATENKI